MYKRQILEELPTNMSKRNIMNLMNQASVRTNTGPSGTRTKLVFGGTERKARKIGLNLSMNDFVSHFNSYKEA